MAKDDKGNIRKELMVVVEELYKRRGDLAEKTQKRVRKEIRRTWSEIKLVGLEAPIIKTVCEETTLSSTGKEVAKYGNESLRKVEITDRLAKDDEVAKLTRTCNLTARLWINTLRRQEADLAREVKKLETMERILLADLERG